MKDGSLTCAKPCVDCINKMKKSRKINKLHYSNNREIVRTCLKKVVLTEKFSRSIGRIYHS